MQEDEALRLQMENMNLKGENRSLRGALAVALAKLAQGEDASVSFASPGSRFHQPPGGWNEVTTCEAVKKAEIATLGPIIEKAAKVKVFHLPACKQLFVKGTSIYVGTHTLEEVLGLRRIYLEPCAHSGVSR